MKSGNVSCWTRCDKFT